MALAMYPQIRPALDKMAAEGTKIEGTAILSEMRMEAVPPGTANQTAETLPKPEAQPEQKKGRFGGLMGGLKKMAEASNQQSSGEQKPQRSIIMTTSIEMLKLTPTVTDDVVAIPAGFKETR
jgi:protoporphyrinogen oxidase